MDINKLDKMSAVYTPVKVVDTNITFGIDGNSLTVDATEHWGAEQSIVDVYTRGAGQPLTLDAEDGNSGIYNVATITIPPQKSTVAEADTQVSGQTKKEEAAAKTEILPLDMEAVQVTLWPLPFEITASTSQEDTAEETAK